MVLRAGNYVIINQIMYDSPYNEIVTVPPYSCGEFVELYNGSPDPVSMQGWYLTGESPTEHFDLPDITIASKGYLVIAYRHADYPSFVLENLFGEIDSPDLQIIYQSKVVLANQGEAITLYNANHDIVDQITYDGESHVSKPDRLSATNADGVPGNECVSLHRTWVEFDAEGKVVPGVSGWKTSLVRMAECQMAETSFGEHYLTGEQPLPIGENYIVSVSPLDPASRVSINDDGISVSNGVRTHSVVTYYDGLGRPVESISIEETPDKSDLVQTTTYNGLHRVSKQWLPVERQTYGAYLDVSTLQSQNSEDRPFTETIYENSALDRIVGKKRPGNNYESHPSTNTYDINSESDIRIYKIVNDSILKANGCYTAGSLFKTVAADEDGIAVTTYTDKLGRNIVEERDGNRTYYVYDDLGRLRYVLPHIPSNKLANGEYAPTNPTLRAAAYYYRYDIRGNMIYKRLPGCEPVYMVYDKAGQLIMTQNGNQRNANKWAICTYDSIGRRLYSGEVKSSSSHAYYMNYFADKWYVEHYGNNPANTSIAGTGYASSVFPKSALTLWTINYYDDYDYLSRLSTPVRQKMRFAQESGYGLQHDNALGLLTGTRVYNLEEGGYTANAFYYDVKGQIVQSRSIRINDNYTSVTSSEYMFDGTIAQQLTLQGTDSNIVKEHYRYTYDHAGRVRKTFYQLNDEEEIILSEFSYDNLGRLVQNLLHNQEDTIHYSYDMRNMLEEIRNKYYSEYLYYAEQGLLEDFAPHAQPRYNGNIAAARLIQGNTEFRFDYMYDALNRLTETTQEALWITKPIEWFQYDARGNITRLQRYSGPRLMDDLNFSYQEDGNQLLSVSDDGADAHRYEVIEYHDLHTGTDSIPDMQYDTNGNLTVDLDRDIYAIRYNSMNLPDTIQFVNGNQIVNLYDAAGRKYKSIIYTNIASAGTQYDEIAHYEFDMDTVVWRVTEYNGNIENHYTSQDTMQRIFNTVGYSTNGTYYHYIKDHLGNICAVVNSEADTLVQSTIYYASGVPMAENLGPDVPQSQYNALGVQYTENFGRDEQPYLYNGKEFVEAHGLNEYDSQARSYYAPIMRTTTMDPLAENYYHISLYAWCGNNPIAFIDPDGKNIYRYDNKTGDIKLYQKTDDNFDQFGKFKYDRKTEEYEPRMKKDGGIKTYTDYRGNNGKIAKGILYDGLNIKQKGETFVSNPTGPTITDYFDFALILDNIVGKEISGFVFETPVDKSKKIVRFEPYKNNSFDNSITVLPTLPEFWKALYHFHTHGQANTYKEATTPSVDRDLVAKPKIEQLYPGIQLLILNNYGAPIKY
jgi:RHS repeat-associated protein